MLPVRQGYMRRRATCAPAVRRLRTRSDGVRIREEGAARRDACAHAPISTCNGYWLLGAGVTDLRRPLEPGRNGQLGVAVGEDRDPRARFRRTVPPVRASP